MSDLKGQLDPSVDRPLLTVPEKSVEPVKSDTPIWVPADQFPSINIPPSRLDTDTVIMARLEAVEESLTSLRQMIEAGTRESENIRQQGTAIKEFSRLIGQNARSIVELEKRVTDAAGRGHEYRETVHKLLESFGRRLAEVEDRVTGHEIPKPSTLTHRERRQQEADAHAASYWRTRALTAEGKLQSLRLALDQPHEGKASIEGRIPFAESASSLATGPLTFEQSR